MSQPVTLAAYLVPKACSYLEIEKNENSRYHYQQCAPTFIHPFVQLLRYGGITTSGSSIPPLDRFSFDAAHCFAMFSADIFAQEWISILRSYRFPVDCKRSLLEPYYPGLTASWHLGLATTKFPNVDQSQYTVYKFRRPFIIGCQGWLTFVSIAPTRASLFTFGVTNGSADSKKWLARQRSDPYVKLARIESFRCRSAFKLLQLQEKLSGSLISPGDIVVDCGAAPGSWSQVATSFVSPSPGGSSAGSSSGLVIAFDLLDFAPLPGVSRFCKVDVRDSAKCVQLVNETVRDYLKRLGSTTVAEGSLSHVNVVLSDMAPNVTGLQELDVPAMMDLANSVLQLAVRTSAPGASLVMKLWQSSEADEFLSVVSRFYRGPWNSAVKPPNHKPYPQTKEKRREDPGPAVRFFKPAASRSDSAEIYLIARGFQLPDDANRC
ncbi:ribosomal RNA large subunit methyltransferase E [Clonorchis sinensis]|uniref:rRNA methyltransferase 2, mitochondrial n=1 Tax=Clonorchis sinensis TaxID=79923 RepID=G7YFP6_CLOSI|nr:ribosomal RNA large subunit methyltransferase E [Clonorchis sinensis]